ncbi:YceI family protein [Rhizobiaceae bacterium n13]|uniref:YceI family protein n=1 Tax=Ferirhizobium litorale TaxID=2927786 RepID=A0AAE3QB26_9HYPH|nr:YceI family protein [Fererhizobium litorale]MDI7861454.1 YceI family protein [Fererhizobium litorale]MDI7921601.1 YceI family protein [Fererhizobium litorale]
MTRMPVVFAALLLSTALPTTGHSATNIPSLDEAAGRYAVTPSSDIDFAIDQIGGGGIRGKFGTFSGTFDLKPGDLAHSMVNFTLKPASVSTGQGRIDAFLRSAAVFDAADYNVISFKSDRVVQTGPETARVSGILTAKGRSNPESFDVKLANWNGKAIGFDVTGKILRSHYAMDVGEPIYSNVVQFNMMIEGRRA